MQKLKTERQTDVSIIVLTYCQENYVSQAIDSILMQETNLKYEILAGDDASTDGTPDILKSYAKENPEVLQLILREKNVGASYNFFDLLRRSKGKYIAVLEGDDFWLDSHKLQKQFDFLESHPEYAAHCSKCLIVDENGKPDYERSCHIAWNKRTFTLEDLLDSWQLPGQEGTVMARNIYREMKPEEYDILYKVHPMVTDKTEALLLLHRGPYYCSNEVLSAYRFVDKKGENNWFSIHHANIYRNYDMFMYPCNLETWARKHMKLPRGKHLGKRNAFRFARFVEECVREPSLQRSQYLAEMIGKSHQPLKYSWYVLKALIEME